MKCLVGIDDTDSSKGSCTTYLAYRIAIDLGKHLKVLPYPRLVRLNPNVPFKTRGNAAVCLPIEAEDPDRAFGAICGKVEELSDVANGANSGLAFLDGKALAPQLEDLYIQALRGIVNPRRVRRFLEDKGVKTMTLGNGMGLVGAACSLAFDERFDHTFELISYRRPESWGTRRLIDSNSVKEMDLATFPHTFNNYDYQKRRVLVAPHGPDPVFAGVRGDSPFSVMDAFASLRFEEELDGHMVYLTNQHTDVHVERALDWKAFSSGWAKGEVLGLRVGLGSHLYASLRSGASVYDCAFYEPTGDLRRAAMLLKAGDIIRVFGGVRRPSASHKRILNVEKLEVLSLAARKRRDLVRGTYLSSPRANRHLTKPLIRYGQESVGVRSGRVEGWLRSYSTRPRELLQSL